MAKLDDAKQGCFYEFFHLFLCDGNGKGPSLHPSNHNANETEQVHPNHDEAKPGLVARLMGLDSLPNTDFVSNGRTSTDLVTRSRSVNFLDYMLKFDVNQGDHRRAKTSASFREVPSLFQHKNHHELVMLYLDSDSEDNELRQRKKQNKEIVRERNHGKSKRISKFKNEPRVVPIKHSSKVVKKGSESSSRSSPTSVKKQKKVLYEPKHTKSIRKQQSQKNIGNEYYSECFIPMSMSILNDNDYPFLYGPDFLDYTSPLMSKSKRESSEQLLFLGNSVEDRANNKGHDNKKEKEHFSELKLKLRQLTKNDIRESDCTLKRLCETQSFEELSLWYEHTIFDSLLHEVVNDLVQLSY